MIVEKDKAIAETQTKRADAEAKFAKLSERYEHELNAQRESLEKDKDNAVNAERAKAFEEKQKKEKRFHDTTWKKERLLVKQIQKAQADLWNEVSCIIGTAPDDPPQLEETEFEEIEWMIQPAEDEGRPNIVGLQERRLGRTISRTYRTMLDLDDVVPNGNQPRIGPKEDEELQRQIEANEGLFESLLVEPHPDLPEKFRIIDGDRRWTNSRVLVERGRDEHRQIPVEVTDRTLPEDERLRVWIYIHRQRKEWDAKDKEMVAYRLVDLLGRASAANVLGITVRELDKLVEVFEISQKFTKLRDPSAAHHLGA
jgi:ParB-like nuclease family protein